MYEQSVSSTTNSPPGQRDSGSSNLRLGGVGPHSTGGGMPQGQLPLSHQQNLAEYSWNSLPQQTPSYPTGAMLQQGPSPPQQTHLQLNLPGPLPPLQAPGPGGQGSFWGSGAGSKESPLSQHQHSPSTSISSSRGGHDSYRQMLHPDEMNSDDELDSSFHSGPSSTTPEVPETSTKKKKVVMPWSVGHPHHTQPTAANYFHSGGTPYIPSYMDLSNGPEPCVVCSDAATGYHYRCMTCEGCKGFFRRTIQKNLQYHCKWNNNCVIDKNTRNQCQQCRFKKCVAVGMATDLVLNDKQRVAKRKLIEENRERRKQESVKMKLKHEQCYHDFLTDEDRGLIDDIVNAYEQTGVNTPKPWTLPEKEDQQHYDSTGTQRTDPEVWQQLAEVMTPSIVKVVEFSKRVPGFIQLNVDDQILLLKSCCMEIMCLRAACRYNPGSNTLTLHNGLTLTKNQLGHGGLGMLVEPIFEFAIGLSKLQLDETELALLAAVLLMQSDRTGLKEPEAVEKIQDAILGAYKRYIAEKRPSQPVHWAKILMKVTDLRTISTRHAERVLCIKLDSPGDIPPLFLEMFDEGGKHLT